MHLFITAFVVLTCGILMGGCRGETGPAGASSGGVPGDESSGGGTSSSGTSSSGTSSSGTSSVGTSSVGTSSVGTSSVGTSSVGTASAGTSGDGAPVSEVLLGIPSGTALDLGPYRCEDRVPAGLADSCRTISDYSRINYDPYNYRIIMFGGGHAATGRTDIDAFDLRTLRWSSIYPSMTCAEIESGDLDSRGFHRSTGHPVARHTYDQNVIVEANGSAYLAMLSTEGFAGDCHPYNAGIRSVARFPLDSARPVWEYSSEFQLPWDYATAAEYDPLSGMVIVIGATRGSGEGGMWVYEPASGSIVAYVDEVEYAANDSNLVYFPPLDQMYYVARGEPFRVFELSLERDDWSQTRSEEVFTTGTSPTGITGTGFAYDETHHVIGGAIMDGLFYTFAPHEGSWTAQEIVPLSTDGAEVGTLQAHALDFDPLSGTYIFITSRSDGYRVWAYRPVG